MGRVRVDRVAKAPEAQEAQGTLFISKVPSQTFTFFFCAPT